MKNLVALPELEAVFQSAPNLVVVLDPAFAIVAANDEFALVTNSRREDLVGKNLFDVFPINPHESEVDGVSSLRASLERVFRTRSPERMAVQRYDAARGRRRRRTEGAVLEAVELPGARLQGPGDVYHSPVRGSHRAASAEKDKTPSMRGLAEANGLFQAMYDQGIFAGRLEPGRQGDRREPSGTGAVRITRREESFGKLFWECGWWNRSPEVQKWVKAAIEQAVRGEPFRGMSPYYCADGSERVVDFACMPIKDEAGKVLFVFPTGIDVTERVQSRSDRSGDGDPRKHYRRILCARPRLANRLRQPTGT